MSGRDVWIEAVCASGECEGSRAALGRFVVDEAAVSETVEDADTARAWACPVCHAPADLHEVEGPDRLRSAAQDVVGAWEDGRETGSVDWDYLGPALCRLADALREEEARERGEAVVQRAKRDLAAAMRQRINGLGLPSVCPECGMFGRFGYAEEVCAECQAGGRS